MPTIYRSVTSPKGGRMNAPVRLQLSRRKGFNLQALSLAVNGLPAGKNRVGR